MQTARLIVHPDTPLGPPGPPGSPGSPGPVGPLGALAEVPGRYQLARGRPVPADLTAAARRIDAAVSYDSRSSKVAVFAVNRDEHRAVRLRVTVRDARIVRVVKHDVLDGLDPRSAPARVAHGSVIDGDALAVVLAPASWTVVHLAVSRRVADLARCAS